MGYNTRKKIYDFRGKRALADNGSATDADFVTATTGSATEDVVNGVATLTLDNTNEAQNACLYMGDEYPFDIDDLIRVEFVAKTSASINAAVSLAMGVTSARNDAIDSIAEAALFRLDGSSSIVVETDDGTNDNDDKATGETFGNSYKRFVIDFATGTKTLVPGPSRGGKGAVQFYVGNSNGSLRRVAVGNDFDMSNYSGSLQLFAQLQKTASTATATLEILEICVEYKVPA